MANVNFDLEGLILHHRDFGYCKVTAHTNNKVRVRFCGTEREAWYSVEMVAQQRDFKWRALPVGLSCKVNGRGECSIAAPCLEVDQESGTYVYSVEFDGDARESARISERELWPIPGSLRETPLTKASGLTVDTHESFVAREGLLRALKQLNRETGGIRSFAASRVILLPHQMFVVGTVVDDPIWRYVLADEVGLGKTVEAGVIAHQLLGCNPKARVLVLCPGPLARQWLCEMHLSFGGRGFHLLDLHVRTAVRLPQWSRVISSIKLALREHRQQMLACKWDLVIVDEAHHLLWDNSQYEFIQELSSQSPRLLMLSAVPAREREQELLRLLQLIDPIRYAPGCSASTRFVELYAAQEVIGRRIRILGRYLESDDQEDHGLLGVAASRLLECELLKDDGDLRAALTDATSQVDVAAAKAIYRKIRDDAIARYRISRRILKNRRARLVDGALITAVPRIFEIVHYTPRPIEAAVAAGVPDLLTALRATPLSLSLLHALFRKSVQALCDPVALYEVISALRTAGDEGTVQPSEIDGSAALDYDEHEVLLEAISAGARPYLDKHALDRLADLLRAWMDDPTQPRVDSMLKVVQELHAEGADKVLVFAGTYGTAGYLSEVLSKHFGQGAVATFQHDMGDDAKEKEVTRFRLDRACRVLVSDESGGEGRNFQFASAIVHFDLPWSVAAVEQRIGRLDRIGRRDPVRSVVICPSDTIDAAWTDCLSSGFEVFGRSISGLEFMLRHTERKVIDMALSEGSNGLLGTIATIRADCEKERASDDADALTDAASFSASSLYLHNLDATADVRLEDSFPRYFRSISRASAAKQVTDQKDLNLRIWRLKPEDVSEVQLPGIEKAGDDPLQDRFGTFSRSVARDRPDLEFFSVGHPLVDAVLLVCDEHVRGRTFAVQVLTSKISIGLYVAVTMKMVCGESRHFGDGQSRAERHLSSRRLRCLINLETERVVTEAETDAFFNKHLTSEGGCRELAQEALAEIVGPYLDDWAGRLNRSVAAAEDHIRTKNLERFGAQDQMFQKQVELEISELKRMHVDTAQEGEAHLLSCAEAVMGAYPVIDSLGVVSIAPARVQ